MTTEAKTPLMQQYDRLKQLKAEAMPINDSDEGSDRQVEAETAFLDAVEAAIGEDDYSLMGSNHLHYKLTTIELLEYAMNCVAFGVEFASQKLGK